MQCRSTRWKVSSTSQHQMDEWENEQERRRGRSSARTTPLGPARLAGVIRLPPCGPPISVPAYGGRVSVVLFFSTGQPGGDATSDLILSKYPRVRSTPLRPHYNSHPAVPGYSMNDLPFVASGCLWSSAMEAGLPRQVKTSLDTRAKPENLQRPRLPEGSLLHSTTTTLDSLTDLCGS